jgi:hypothetical protein
MRMMPLLTVVVALGLSMMILGGLGVSDWLGTAGSTGLEEDIEDSSSQDNTLQPEEGDEGGFFSFVVSGLRQIRDTVSLLLFLPSTLNSFGAPPVVSRAIGHGIQLIITIGLVQVALRWEVK